ncbi:hypothetical protein GCU60_06740 [Blastococcus saxobsidens]|uniref:Uncharacterized protein n=1 Tax=Blastococcus saxobsidens TaxID=138336 RepID=A0A6L9W031_9ACTN|nr:hypothetical protein [Blastococcus saxobsidens]NEK85457.1 hypothetical protein [Blastococcus saxobsidens]
MAISVLDVRDTLAPAHVRVPRAGGAADGTATADLRWVPVPALVAGLLAVLQAVGLLAVGLTRIDTVLSSPQRPPGLVIVAGLVALAGWIVLSAGGGAALIDGVSRRLVVRTSAVELVAVTLVGAAAVVLPVPAALNPGLPLPIVFAVAISLPVTKLLLAGSASARRWVAQAPRVPVRRRPDPVARHRVLCTLTLGVIALGLGGLALATPVQNPADVPASSVVYHP